MWPMKYEFAVIQQTLSMSMG